MMKNVLYVGDVWLTDSILGVDEKWISFLHSENKTIADSRLSPPPSGAQFAANVYNNKVKQCGIPRRIRCKFTITCCSNVPTSIPPMIHIIWPTM